MWVRALARSVAFARACEARVNRWQMQVAKITHLDTASGTLG